MEECLVDSCFFGDLLHSCAGGSPAYEDRSGSLEDA
jgi:hypothetical protein